MGVRLSAGCLVVVSLSPVIIEDNASVTPAEKAGLSVGDRITHIAGKPVESINSLQDLLAKNGSKPLALRVVRGSQTLTLTLSPARSAADGLYKIGALLRDNMAGIGTMTFYDPHTRLFGALGHGINELKSDRLLPMGTGTAMDAEITGVRKGESGKPGELLGKLDEETGGTIYANTEFGVFGHLTGDELVPNGLLMDVAAPKQVSVGPATILSCVGGHEVRPYQIEILRVYPNATGPRSFMLRVTDPELIEQTGGIVQGMSGSPVIQDGRLVGAVTHVMVGDPLRGYGIFASRMIETAMDGQKAAA
jgi:stage IV sporulation protein B